MNSLIFFALICIIPDTWEKQVYQTVLVCKGGDWIQIWAHKNNTEYNTVCNIIIIKNVMQVNSLIYLF